MGDYSMNMITNNINSIKELVNIMQNLPQLDAPVKHHFSKGVYAREIFMPKDMWIVGKVHKTRHLNIISQGKCTVVTPTRRLEVEAPFTFESFEGEQKVVYMHEAVVWTTIHLTEETDLAKIEEQCIAKVYDEQLIKSLIESFGGTPCLGV
tara:strand:+ start:5423 stop:5875 length:453 start_codon:yes stop_codon:yes gene_type:complete